MCERGREGSALTFTAKVMEELLEEVGVDDLQQLGSHLVAEVPHGPPVAAEEGLREQADPEHVVEVRRAVGLGSDLDEAVELGAEPGLRPERLCLLRVRSPDGDGVDVEGAVVGQVEDGRGVDLRREVVLQRESERAVRGVQEVLGERLDVVVAEGNRLGLGHEGDVRDVFQQVVADPEALQVKQARKDVIGKLDDVVVVEIQSGEPSEGSESPSRHARDVVIVQHQFLQGVESHEIIRVDFSDEVVAQNDLADGVVPVRPTLAGNFVQVMLIAVPEEHRVHILEFARTDIRARKLSLLRRVLGKSTAPRSENLISLGRKNKI